MFKGLFKKQYQFQLRNQNHEINNCTKKEVLSFIELMINNYDEFIVLCPVKPIDHIHFVQAAQIKNGIDVQVSTTKDNNRYLYHKVCQKEETIKIFMDFYEGKVPQLNNYQLMEF